MISNPVSCGDPACEGCAQLREMLRPRYGETVIDMLARAAPLTDLVGDDYVFVLWHPRYQTGIPLSFGFIREVLAADGPAGLKSIFNTAFLIAEPVAQA